MKNRQEDVKKSIGNGVTKALIYMAHGYELSGGLPKGVVGIVWRGLRGENWNNYNSTINKIYLTKEKKKH